MNPKIANKCLMNRAIAHRPAKIKAKTTQVEFPKDDTAENEQ